MMIRSSSSSTTRLRFILVAMALVVLAATGATAQKCDGGGLSRCQQLSAQGASISWNYAPQNGSLLEMSFSGTAVSSSGWVAWGINPTSPQMAGTTALIAFQNSSGAFLLMYEVTAAVKGGAALLPVGNNLLTSKGKSFNVVSRNLTMQGTSVRISATLRLTSPMTTINHVWNRGPGLTSGDQPLPHSTSGDGLLSSGKLDLLSGATSGSSVPHLHLKNAHGILNAVSWGIMLPLGVMSARYLRQVNGADPAWFYLHATCQTLGYILGVVGWAVGLKLGALSSGVVRTAHRNIGITIFSLGTLQVLALFLRPNKTHKLRVYWAAYHHAVGYATISLSIANIFKGFNILEPGSGWKRAYIGVIASLLAISVIFELVSWLAYFRGYREKKNDLHKQQQQQQQQRWDDGPVPLRQQV